LRNASRSELLFYTTDFSVADKNYWVFEPVYNYIKDKLFESFRKNRTFEG